MRQLKITQSITNRRESHTLEKYFTEVSNVSMITPDEEVNLAQRIREGDQLALEKLVKSNLRFVVSVAKQYQNRSLPLNDLINEGNLGLIKAAKKFDETKGFKFISYAVWWIRQSIMQALAEQSRIVRLPMNKSGAINQIRRAYAELEQKYEREPTEEELADILDMKPNEIRNTLGAEVKQTSMDAPFGEEESGSLLDVLENQTTGPVLLRQIAGAVAKRIVLYAKKGHDCSQGKDMGFIKFGSRVDLFLPINAKINIKIDDTVKGGQTIIASC